MKVPASIRNVYDDRKPIYLRLKQEIDKKFNGLRQPRWHYESRVKELESFTQKLESGRVESPETLEDFFACTLVVPNLIGIEAAEHLTTNNFNILQRRPPRADRTHKTPDSFPFDDLRLYVSIKSDVRLPPTGLEHLRFEVQVKTFLQHAWSIATHELVYKTQKAEWPKERIAFQVKAMLEHAEVAIEEAAHLSKSRMIAKDTAAYERIGRVISLIEKHWGIDAPTDVRRLAANLHEICELIQVSGPRLRKILEDYVSARGGVPPNNLSPYLAVMESLLLHEPEKMKKLLYNEQRKATRKLLLTREIELPASIEKTRAVNAIFLD